MSVPAIRIRALNQARVRASGRYVLYWMVAARRTRHNFAMDRALGLAVELGCGLLVLEPLRAGHRWASDRMHAFIIDGMRDNEHALANTPVCYYPYIEPHDGAGRGLLQALARRARVVVTDDFPCFFLPRMLARAAASLDVRLEAIDSNGIQPMRATERVFTTAASFRRHLQGELPAHLGQGPRVNPLDRRSRYGRIPAVDRGRDIARTTLRRWPPAALRHPNQTILADLAIDHTVPPVELVGGPDAATSALRHFLDHDLERFADARNQVVEPAQSGLSPYLHFGHLSPHQVFSDIVAREGWTPERLPDKPTGRRVDWWHMSPGAEAFLDQLITWRELGLNMCAHRPDDHDRYDSLPAWALTTLAEHADDPRPHVYSDEDLDHARTHDPVWNAAQRQLRRDGVIHNYLRMLWGKKILEWSPSPERALERMIELNNRYAVDGRDPNSYSGIFWVLGRYDRAWGPERPIFGKVRYMSSDSTRRKLDLAPYLERYGE